MRGCYKTTPPDGIVFTRLTLANVAPGRMRRLCPHPARHFDYGKPLVIFLQEHDRLIREVSEQPVDARLVIQDVVQLIDVCGIAAIDRHAQCKDALPSYSDARLAPFQSA